MTWFHNLKIASKLLVTFFALSALTLLLGVFALHQMEQMQRANDEVSKNAMPSITYVSSMNTDTSDFRISELQHILSPDAAQMAFYERDMRAEQESISANLKKYAPLISTDEERRLYDEFTRLWKEYQEEHEKVLSLSRENKNEEARNLLRGRSQEAFNSSSEKLDELTRLNLELGKKEAERSDATHELARGWILAAMGGSILLGLLLSMTVARIISRPLNNAVHVTDRIAEGDLTVNIEVSTQDEAGRLL
ncbi:MAG TPA: MCP four helix bundle domain-containing protein, partial [Archangium sp.]|nr:MCP four helix bundle domain-containing protein [Archangium sp.]